MTIKKITAVVLAVFMLVGMCLSITSCRLENVTAYTQLRDHVDEVSAGNGAVNISIPEANYQVAVSVEQNGQMLVRAQIADSSNYYYSVDLVLTNQTNTYNGTFMITYYGAVVMTEAEFKVLAGNYTGLDTLVFESSDITAMYELEYRQLATGLLNSLLLALDTYCQKNVSVSLNAFGFTTLADSYRYTPEDAAPAEDLGGAFSLERLALAGTMVVVGMGMVFLVLAILWGVLIIFKKVMYDGANKKKEEATKSVANPPAISTPDDEMVAAIAGAMAYAQDDGAIAAAITAAIAEMIASDENLSREFAGGFRVVSFRKKSGKGAWNK